MEPRPEIPAFFDEPTKTVTYVVWEPGTLAAVAAAWGDPAERA